MLVLQLVKLVFDHIADRHNANQLLVGNHGEMAATPNGHLPSQPGELHPELLTEPCLKLSLHTARATREGCRLPVQSGSSGCPLTRFPPSDPPPSLHGHYAASSLLLGSPSLTNASILSASCCALVPFLFASPVRFSSSVLSPE